MSSAGISSAQVPLCSRRCGKPSPKCQGCPWTEVSRMSLVAHAQHMHSTAQHTRHTLHMRTRAGGVRSTPRVRPRETGHRPSGVLPRSAGARTGLASARNATLWPGLGAGAGRGGFGRPRQDPSAILSSQRHRRFDVCSLPGAPNRARALSTAGATTDRRRRSLGRPPCPRARCGATASTRPRPRRCSRLAGSRGGGGTRRTARG